MVDGSDVRQAAGAARRAAGDAERHASRLERSRTMRTLARAGHVANGVVHLALAGVAVAVAVGAGGSADQGGAMQAIASTPFGLAALWAIAVAMIALAAFAILEGVAQRASEGAKALAKGIGKAVAYGAIAATGISTAVRGGGGGSDGDQQAQSATGTLMAQPFGQVLVGVVGAGIVAIGVAFVVQGARRSFEKHISPPPAARHAATVLGVVGYVAKGVAIGVVGVLFVVAAIAHDPGQAGGLDDALTSLRELPFGVVVLLAVALGIGAYGVFSIARGIWTSKR